MNKLMLLASAGLFFVAPAQATTVYNTSLPDLNDTRGDGVATTTTDATGTRTTVAGSPGGANRVSAPITANSWIQANVGSEGTVGITTDYARSGNGSAYFSTVNDGSKADLQYYFAGLTTGASLASLTSVSYDFFRDASSTTNPNFAGVLRLDIAKDGAFAGSLVFENVYQTQQAAPTDSWTTLTASLDSGIFWATSTALGPNFANANGGQKTLQAWIDDNAGANLTVYGLSLGVGSGWGDGQSFTGAIDNVSLQFAGGPEISANFEVAAAAVPEPAAWALMIGGFGLVGGTLRRRSIRDLAAA
ncbi:PEPxxWA-CTERM sorting domain-containing protein [Sphingomonas sp. 1P06PA]|uniref:PEPxxWA-CTERM sorting domain-containing protein n=1 Tax=Sphingomonas sp. 1P06PA TaxID=554121 RepID=UPI0039A40D23